MTDVGELRDQVVAARRTVSTAAERLGLAVAASGTSPHSYGDPRTTDSERYRRMIERYGEVARSAGTCGMHVHVQVDGDEEGVRVLDGIAPWLPVLLALSSNSPFHHGRDTGYASWRSRDWDRWPSAGPTDPFGDVAGYEAACRALIDAGAALDEGMLYFDARLAVHHPTVEVRVHDVCTDPDDVVVIAALVRGLVERAVEEGGRLRRDVRLETLRAARWRAARFGLSDSLVHPVSGALCSARDVLDALVAHVAEPLAAAGDRDVVDAGVARLLASTGASRQRAAHARAVAAGVADQGGDPLDAVVDDLVVRTGACLG